MCDRCNALEGALREAVKMNQSLSFQIDELVEQIKLLQSENEYMSSLL